MEIDCTVVLGLLRLIKAGSMEVSANGKKSICFSFCDNKITVDLLDIAFNIPTTTITTSDTVVTREKRRAGRVFTRLNETRKFAEKLKKKNLTLCISHQGKTVIKLGKEAKPKLSRIILKSSSVEVANLRELRKLYKLLYY